VGGRCPRLPLDNQKMEIVPPIGRELVSRHKRGDAIGHATGGRKVRRYAKVQSMSRLDY
jgi:hypothetical protein